MVKNERSYTSASPICLHSLDRDNFLTIRFTQSVQKRSPEMAARVTLPFGTTSRNFCTKTSLQERVWDAWRASIRTAVLKQPTYVTMNVRGVDRRFVTEHYTILCLCSTIGTSTRLSNIFVTCTLLIDGRWDVNCCYTYYITHIKLCC